MWKSNHEQVISQKGNVISGSKGGEKIIAQVVVFERIIADIAEKDAVDVGQKDISCFSDNANIILDMKRDLEIIAPVASLVAVVGEDRVVEENLLTRQNRRGVGPRR